MSEREKNGRSWVRITLLVVLVLAIGGALFLLSDLILAARLFNEVHFPLIGDVIWLTYGPAQMLIVYSVGSALRWIGMVNT